jgi:hypothetical protein
MIVANVWKYTAEHGLCPPNGLPNLKCYYLGLNFARTAFKHAIEGFADSEDDFLLWDIRSTLKSTRFADLWDRLWQ